MSFGMIALNQKMNKKQNCVTWIQTKTEGIYLDIVKYVETRFDTSNYQLERTLPKYNI